MVFDNQAELGALSPPAYTRIDVIKTANLSTAETNAGNFVHLDTAGDDYAPGVYFHIYFPVATVSRTLAAQEARRDVVTEITVGQGRVPSKQTHAFGGAPDVDGRFMQPVACSRIVAADTNLGASGSVFACWLS